ncbi:hypothetical protein SOASR030_32290 [Leminorella grimontii]|uniref:Uncharacterized protein n=1 Tax=Leminorella grimontii TaxID=82981 RepID=A0AAV5N8Q5_9GAMM|nr:hypothetical protein [Leminorella grimontii]KFC92624.1 hypothetical protein GLGR_3733 [Leminorella grimontii ATCC 33999 = DSM 5078]GKX57117.1 hypothetical protein SOASR030_32290 [Leminorella grimontii]GKX60118.1 hypothetical protein SOASR031_24330 [Leminorella grimontii]VFS62574.1 Uncharacterised protein [Leminorella grimontii]
MRLVDEEKNTPVVTTRQIMSGSVLITHVFYDDDGAWQLFGGETISEADTVVVSVQQILSQDDSLLALPDIEMGRNVYRESRVQGWTTY